MRQDVEEQAGVQQREKDGLLDKRSDWVKTQWAWGSRVGIYGGKKPSMGASCLDSTGQLARWWSQVKQDFRV